jgi:hypothetical protein
MRANIENSIVTEETIKKSYYETEYDALDHAAKDEVKYPSNGTTNRGATREFGNVRAKEKIAKNSAAIEEAKKETSSS